MRRTVSCNSQLSSKPQTVYTLRVKKSHVSEASNHKSKLHVVGKLHIANRVFHRGIYTNVIAVVTNNLK